MIVTVTLNPAVDISYRLNDFVLNDGNRVTDVSKTAGGKGLNVARVVNQLGEQVGATGFLGGSLGEFIRRELKSQLINDLFVEIAGETRNCIAILHNGMQTEILESGPTISEAELETFLQRYKQFIEKASIITISGSLPKGVPNDFYARLIAIGNEANKCVLLDTGGSMTKAILQEKEKPFLIKPNESEFGDLIGAEKLSKEEIISSLTDDLLFSRIEWVVVSLGKEGAIIKHQKDIYDVTIPTVSAVNPVGSGDSVIAGFAVALKRKYLPMRAITFGLTMGILNAMEEKTGSINVDRITEIEKQIIVNKL